MKFNIITLFTILALTTLITVISCRKTDQPEGSTDITNFVENKFFNTNRTSDLTEQSLVRFIMRENNKNKFVEKAVSQIGYPRWDKIVKSENSKSNSFKGSSDSLLVSYYLPFVRDSQNYVNATMIIHAGIFDTTFSYICDWQYNQIQNSNSNITDSAEYYAVFFMCLDNRVFGYNKFTITDTTLFNNGQNTPLFVTLDSTIQSSKSNTLIAIDHCWQVTVIYQVPCISVKPASKASRIEIGFACFTQTYQTYCWTEYINTNDGQTGAGGSTGGGGGNYGLPPSCNGSTTVSKVNTQTLPCGSGWTPIYPGTEAVYNPSLGAALFDNFFVSSSDQEKIDFWRNNNIDTLGLDSCRRQLLNKLINILPSSPLGAFLSKLDKAVGLTPSIDKFNVHFFTRPLPNNNAFTEHPSYDPVTNEYDVDIILDSVTAVNSTDIFIANAILHEVIHAYMAYIWRKFNAGASAATISGLTHGTIFEAYVDTLKKRDSLNPNMNQWLSERFQHNYMADQVLEYMADMIKLFDNNPSTPDRYYWYLAWAGLTRKSIKTWNYHWPNYPSWPPSNPAPVNDSTRGLRYALTLSRIDTINKVLYDEEHSTINARGKKPVLGGCY